MNNLVNKKSNLLKNRKGFTLIELIVVIVIIGILAAILIPRFSGFTDKARITDAVIKAKQMATAMESTFAEKGTWAAVGTAKNEVASMAGISVGSEKVTAWTIGNAGEFTVTITDGTAFTAGRTGPDDPIHGKAGSSL